MRISWGSGYASKNYPELFIKIPGEEDFYPDIDPDAELIITKIAEKAQKNIGEFILKSGDIENLLWNEIIRFINGFEETQGIFAKISAHSKLAREIVNKLRKNGLDSKDTEFKFTFGQKKELLKIIMELYPKNYPLISRSEIVRLFKEIEEVILFRNALAHGSMTVDYETKCASISFINRNSGELMNYSLSDEKNSEFKQKFSYLILFLFCGLHPAICVATDYASSDSS